jgi:hypothetical protein
MIRFHGSLLIEGSLLKCKQHNVFQFLKKQLEKWIFKNYYRQNDQAKYEN